MTSFDKDRCIVFNGVSDVLDSDSHAKFEDWLENQAPAVNRGVSDVGISGPAAALAGEFFAEFREAVRGMKPDDRLNSDLVFTVRGDSDPRAFGSRVTFVVGEGCTGSDGHRVVIRPMMNGEARCTIEGVDDPVEFDLREAANWFLHQVTATTT